MKHKKYILSNWKSRSSIIAGLLFGISTIAEAQTSYSDVAGQDMQVVDRIESKSAHYNSLFSTSNQAIPKKNLVTYLSQIIRDAKVGHYAPSRVDQVNIERLVASNGEWFENASGEPGFSYSKKPFLKYFYPTKSDFLLVNEEDFFLSINPVFYGQGRVEEGDAYIATNTRGLTLRGNIAQRIGFYTMLADNQERLPQYLNSWLSESRGQMPGVHIAPLRGQNYDVFLANGYIDFAVIKDHLNLSFGYDKQHIGYGIRSLVYGRETAPSTFLRWKMKWGKFHYESLMLEQTVQRPAVINDGLWPKKYAAIHQLNFIQPRWSVGIFESSVLAKQSGVPIGVFAPVIGVQSLSKQWGNASVNNAWGLQFKAIPLRNWQVYGQAFLDQLDFGSLGKGSLKNRYGFQFGTKYFDVAGISNLDLQAEVNVVRPFTYQGESDTVSNFTHYNQPMAHPLGNQFLEVVGQVNYQPRPLWNINARAVLARTGTGGGNVGNSLFEIANQHRFPSTNAYPMAFDGRLAYGNINVAYQFAHNMFIEAGATYVDSRKPDQVYKGLMFQGGIRCNIARKQYDFH